MERNSEKYSTYLQILRKELIPALGCTEPIAVAYCAAIAGKTLGSLPERVEIEASGNIIKNVKSVIVPNTDGRRGVEAAAAVGIIAGDADAGLEVISHVTREDKRRLGEYLETTPIKVTPAGSELVLDVTVSVFSGNSSARARIINHHTGLALIEKDGKVLFTDQPVNPAAESGLDYGLLSVEGIYDFAQSLDVKDVQELFDRQIEYNCAISQEGLNGNYGANIGKVLVKQGDDVHTLARAKAAAASDARMGGCELPVIINSGSGNQGITVCVPVVEYAMELGSSREKLYRALAISNLTAIHLKEGIGRLSAYCGAVSAGASAGAAVSYLRGGDLDSISHALVNALAISSGMVCDGAKPSCAAKIAVAVDSGLLAMEMYDAGQQFYGGDGIILKGVENTIRNVGVLGRQGMKETDRTIIELMTK
ncbi:MAG: L-serine ammonia-lyase, iron-sulfur-dependent, subunit alpha [Clostridiales bacterium]|nr:L-serine ammonia-lyase, iron-sulfur-dependent, subunit alpha [Clostridiales bacterium]